MMDAETAEPGSPAKHSQNIAESTSNHREDRTQDTPRNSSKPQKPGGNARLGKDDTSCMH